MNVSDGTLSNTLRMTDAHITLWVLWLLTVKSDVLQALHGQLDAHSITSESSQCLSLGCLRFSDGPCAALTSSSIISIWWL